MFFNILQVQKKLFFIASATFCLCTTCMYFHLSIVYVSVHHFFFHTLHWDTVFLHFHPTHLFCWTGMWVGHHALTFLLEIHSSGDSYARNFRDKGLKIVSWSSESGRISELECFFDGWHNHNLKTVEYKWNVSVLWFVSFCSSISIVLVSTL